jgi:putative ABC transport system permease protein
MRLYDIAQLYTVRLKARVVLVQELFAVMGIAVGVALLFASQVASTSLNGSVSQLTDGIVGQSQYQLKARGPEGFSEALLGEVRALPGVRAAVPVLEHEASVIGPTGREQAVDMIATDPRYVHLAGPLLRHLSAQQLAGQRALALPAPVAHAIGASSLEPIKVQVGTRIVPSLLATILQSSEIGSLVHSPVALAPLAYAQTLTGMSGKVTRIFVQTAPGKTAQVHAGLVRIAGDHLNVEPGDFDSTLFAQAATPINQSTQTFAAICALVGFMFAFCSMLLTMHLRQGLVRELRLGGATRWEAVKALLFDALVLGSLASLLGLALGDLLSILVFGSNPGYLSFAFPVGSQRIVTWQSIAIAAGAGFLAACVGVLTPLRDIWTRARRTDIPGEPGALTWWTAATLAGGLACLGVTTAILFAAPQSAIVGIVTLILALFLLLPLLIDAIVWLFDCIQRPIGAGSTEIAVVELRSPKTRVRSVAIAATGAIAVFGSVTIQGSHTSLQGGLNRLVHQLSVVSDLWVISPGEQNLLATTPFRGTAGPTLAHLPGVGAVGLYRASFLDVGDRRVWVLAPPPTVILPLPPSQLVTGDLQLATARLHRGGWAVLSQALAAQLRVRIGGRFTLPSPRATSFRLAALSTNLGWPPGAVILNSADYARAWGSPDPSAYNIMLAPGASSTQVGHEITKALGPASGLVVQTAYQREQTQLAASRRGLARLAQIALLVLIAGVLAMAISMGTVIWQRRPRFARMRVQGFRRQVLWLALLWESALLLGAGCLIGASFGIYGQLLLSHALLSVTGFPVVFSARVPVAIGSFAIVTAVAAAVVAIPGYRAAGVRPNPHPYI